MAIEVGIMHGRLTPPFEGRFQAFPANSWRQEFHNAKAAGLSCIEWIYEKPHEDDNPLGTNDGVAEIRALANETGVRVSSICADYYMEERLIGDDASVNQSVADHLRWLIGRAGTLGVAYIVLPFVDSSSLKDDEQITALTNLLRDIAPDAHKADVELHLETDLPPKTFRALLDKVDNDAIRVNFDIGNSAALGYDPEEELTLLAPYLGSVHVKDRVFGGGTVSLGSGNADFETCFRKITEANFERWFILQVARGDDGDEVAWSIANRNFVERHVADLL